MDSAFQPIRIHRSGIEMRNDALQFRFRFVEQIFVEGRLLTVTRFDSGPVNWNLIPQRFVKALNENGLNYRFQIEIEEISSALGIT